MWRPGSEISHGENFALFRGLLMNNLGSEKLITLGNIYIKTLFAFQYYHGENMRQEEWESNGRVLGSGDRSRLVYLAHIYLGYMWELFNFIGEKGLGAISGLESDVELRSRLRGMRNSVFHSTTREKMSERFDELIAVNKDWKIILMRDLATIGKYIYELLQADNPTNALSFKKLWVEISPFH